MRIIDIPEFKDKKALLTLDSDVTVHDAAKEMKRCNFGAVVVTRNGKLCGIFTERDTLMKVVAEKKDPTKLKLSDVMTKNVKTARIDDEVADSMRRMSQGRFRHLPIVDEEGNLTGMISQGDFVAITWYQLLQRFKMHLKSSFGSYTQLWMLVLAVLIYITIAFKIF